jgi:periplasmic copper chaperone A
MIMIDDIKGPMTTGSHPGAVVARGSTAGTPQIVHTTSRWPTPSRKRRPSMFARTTRRTVLSALAGAAVLALPALAHHAGDHWHVGDLVVSHAWTQETAAMADGTSVFLTIANQGEAPDRLLAASVDFAHGAVFQARVLGDDGAVRTATVPAIEIGAGERLTLQPGGIEILLTGLQRQYARGEHFHMTLAFERAGEVEIDVDVEAIGARDAAPERPAS